MFIDNLDIDSWKYRITADPDKAAELFYSNLELLDKDIKRSVFASIVSKDDIISAFREASENPDKPLGASPLFVKDLFHVKGEKTGAGSSFLKDFLETPKESAQLHQRFIDSGAVYCGKTQMNEFAYGLTGRNLHFGNCPHPHIKGSYSGGSSSGSAWVVSRKIAPLSLGTDTGGSIRVPAAFCNIFGMRLTPDSWAGKGVFPLAPSFDVPGWFTSNASDMLTVNRSLIPTDIAVRDGIKGAFFCADNIISISKPVAEKYRKFASELGFDEDSKLSAELEPVFKTGLAAYAVLQSQEAFKVHESWLDNMKDHYNPDVWKRIDRGRHWSVTESEQASDHRAKIRSVFSEYFKEYDVLLMPAVPMPSYDSAQFTQEFRNDLLALNAPASLAGLPALTIPIELDAGQGIGVQAIFPSTEAAAWEPLLKRLIDAD